MPNYDVKVQTRVVTYEEVTHHVSADTMLDALTGLAIVSKDEVLSITRCLDEKDEAPVDYVAYATRDQSPVANVEAPPEPSTDSEYVPYSSRNEEAAEEVVEETTDSDYVPYSARTTTEAQPQEVDCEDDDCYPDDCDCNWEDDEDNGLDELTDEQRGVGSVYFPASDEEDQGDYIPYNQRYGISSGFVPCSQLVDITSTPEPVVIENGTEDGYVPYSQLKLTVG